MRPRIQRRRAEFERLWAMWPTDLAAELMPASGPDGPTGFRGKILSRRDLCKWLLRAYPRDRKYKFYLDEMVCEAMQVLEHAELVKVSWFKTGSENADPVTVCYSTTRLGAAVLANGNFSQRIKGLVGPGSSNAAPNEP